MQSAYVWNYIREIRGEERYETKTGARANEQQCDSRTTYIFYANSPLPSSLNLRPGSDCFAISDHLCLRRLPTSLGGHARLIVRYANLKGHYLNSVDCRFSIIKRSLDEAGDGIINTLNLKWDSEGMVGLPQAFFLTHTIDENSPLYDPGQKYKCRFDNIIRIFISISGWDCDSQEHTTGR